MKKLFTVAYGSGLYGTRTPTSDRDIKHVVLPSINHLLLCKKVVNIANHTNNVENVRNSVDDVDEEFIPLQVFAHDFMMGQTYALELAFAIDSNHAEQTFYSDSGIALTGRTEATRDVMWEETSHDEVLFIQFVKELRQQFLTSNINALMRYVVNQANIYSFKGERLNVSRELLEILKSRMGADGVHGDKSLNELIEWENGQGYKETGLAWDVLQLSIKYPKYFKVTEYDIGRDRKRPCFSLLEKTLPLTMTLSHTIGVVQTIVSKYGSRANAASETNVDWKAMMHALRIVDEGLMILSEHRLSFPFDSEYVEHLLMIKSGKLPLVGLKEELVTKLEKLKELEISTTLPPTSTELDEKFEAFMMRWLRKFYNLKGK